MQHHFSDLEVVPSNGADAPEVRPADGKIALPRTNEMNEHKIYNGQDEDWGTSEKMEAGTEEYAAQKPPRRRCCGFAFSRRLVYVLIALAVLIIIAAAVGGGVGGSMASRKENSTDDDPVGGDLNLNTTGTISDTLPTTTKAPTPTTTIEVTITTSTIDVSPSETAFSDCPSSDGTAYAVDNGSGDSPALIFRKACGASFGTLSPLTIIGEEASSLNDCIRMCVAGNTLNATQNDNNPCNTVCWRNGSQGDDLPYHCFGGYKANNTERYTQVSEARCDSATWINEGNGTNYEL